MDGNYSVKRVANAGLVDTKEFPSDYILPREYVDRFKDEVTHRAEPEDTAEVSTTFWLINHRSMLTLFAGC